MDNNLLESIGNSYLLQIFQLIQLKLFFQCTGFPAKKKLHSFALTSLKFCVFLITSLIENEFYVGCFDMYLGESAELKRDEGIRPACI